VVDDASPLALEPRQAARRDDDHIHPQPEPHLQFTGHPLGGGQTILYF
jgi:hypothetical protein